MKKVIPGDQAFACGRPADLRMERLVSQSVLKDRIPPGEWLASGHRRLPGLRRQRSPCGSCSRRSGRRPWPSRRRLRLDPPQRPGTAVGAPAYRICASLPGPRAAAAAGIRAALDAAWRPGDDRAGLGGRRGDTSSAGLQALSDAAERNEDILLRLPRPRGPLERRHPRRPGHAGPLERRRLPTSGLPAPRPGRT